MSLPSLKEAAWLQRPEVQAVLRALNAPDAETRAVGGAVRNALMGLAVSEVDFATTALPARVMALAEAAGLKAVPTGGRHGTVTVIAGGKGFEVTTLRRDVETDGRHAKVAFTDDWAEDAKRRDFTFNALYADASGTVFDPLGGYDDLMAARVRFIGDPEQRIKEDYLRILRFFRFHATYAEGPMDRAGLSACVRLREGLTRLSAERVWAELRQILVAPHAVAAVRTLYDHGLLSDMLGSAPRLPQFERLAAIEAALEAAPEAALRLGVLAVFVAEDADRLALRFRLSNAEQSVLCLTAEAAGFETMAAEEPGKALLYRLGEADFRHAVLISWAGSGDGPEDAAWGDLYWLPARWRAPRFPLRGEDMLTLGLEGPAIGKLLRQIEQEWIATGFRGDHAALLDTARALAKAEMS